MAAKRRNAAWDGADRVPDFGRRGVGSPCGPEGSVQSILRLAGGGGARKRGDRTSGRGAGAAAKRLLRLTIGRTVPPPDPPSLSGVDRAALRVKDDDFLENHRRASPVNP